MRNHVFLRKFVIWLSVLICLLSFGYAIYASKAAHTGVPLWDKLAMAYGGVFCVFLFFDEFGRQSAKWRSERGPSATRPRPVAAPHPGQRAAVAGAPDYAAGQIHLERVHSDTAQRFREMVRQYCEEVWALEERRPQLDEHGNVIGLPMDQWLSDETVHPFYIMNQDRRIGCVVIQTASPAAPLRLFYVDSAARRRQGGRLAMQKVAEFVNLLGVSEQIVAELATVNQRGRSFLMSCGFRPTEQDVKGKGLTTLVLHVKPVANP